MESNPEYIRWKSDLEYRDIAQQRKTVSEIQAMRETAAKLSLMNLQEFLRYLEATGEENAFWFPALPSYEPENYLDKIQNSKNFNLLKYLVWNGYIDENYAAYVSYFYPNSLTAQDRNFLLSITDRAPLEYAYRLNRPDAVDRKSVV